MIGMAEIPKIIRKKDSQRKDDLNDFLRIMEHILKMHDSVEIIRSYGRVVNCPSLKTGNPHFS
ncbi:MAG: hypothetical protein ACFFB3_20300 [Candidatus Hodarchaeota archaeon]